MMFETLFAKKKYKSISPRETKEKLDTNNNIFLIDVRTPEEYADMHIPKSKSLPLNQLASGISTIVKNKDDEVIVYCLSGVRSASACRQLSSMGYTNVSDMGGIQSWSYETARGRR